MGKVNYPKLMSDTTISNLLEEPFVLRNSKHAKKLIFFTKKIERSLCKIRLLFYLVFTVRETIVWAKGFPVAITKIATRK